MRSKWNFLIVLVLLATLLSGIAGAAQAADPAASPYIIVFKETVNPAAAAAGRNQRLAGLRTCRPPGAFLLTIPRRKP